MCLAKENSWKLVHIMNSSVVMAHTPISFNHRSMAIDWYAIHIYFTNEFDARSPNQTTLGFCTKWGRSTLCRSWQQRQPDEITHSLWLRAGAEPVRRNRGCINGQVEMRVLVGRVTNVCVRGDECLKNELLPG